MDMGGHRISNNLGAHVLKKGAKNLPNFKDTNPPIIPQMGMRGRRGTIPLRI